MDIILFCEFPLLYSSMNFSILYLNLESNVAQMAIVLQTHLSFFTGKSHYKITQIYAFAHVELHGTRFACKSQHLEIQYDLPQG